MESILEAYTIARRELRDPHFLDRARLASELALTRWLMYGVHAENEDVVADAVTMLEDLDQVVAESEPTA